MPDTLARQFTAGLTVLSLQATEQQRAQLLAFLAMLEKWNRAYNLSGIKTPQQMLSLHLLDSLSIARWLKGSMFIDIGTGPGLPGIPLAILFPECHFTLLDSNGKKIRFILQVVHDLQLQNIDVVQKRAEEYRPAHSYHGVISRAFASLQQMLLLSDHLVAEEGYFYAMKGQYPAQELSELPKNYKVVACRQIQVPGVDADRHLVEIIKVTQ